MSRIVDSVFLDLRTLCNGRAIRNVSLRQLTYWKVGGEASIVIYPSNKEELSLVRQYCFQRDIPQIVIGSGSNLLVADAYIDAVFIVISREMAHSKVDGNGIHVHAGLYVPTLARMAMKANLTGLEHVAGIPGTVGGLVFMNGGSLRQSVSEVIQQVETVDRSGASKIYTAQQCEFSYRASMFQSTDEAISDVHFLLSEGPGVSSIRKKMLGILESRRKKFPRKAPNCGSVFKNNPTMYEKIGPPGKVIELCGLKGFRIGDAGVSEEHANFILNYGNAKAEDILRVISHVRSKVLERYEFQLECEVRYLDPSGKIVPADKVVG